MNKKIIFVILLFIGVSFIVYSFANPLTSDDKKMKDDEQYNENLDDDNDSSFEDSDSDSEDDESDEVTSEEDKEEEPKPEENSDLTVANQNTSSSGRYYYSNSKKPNTGGTGVSGGSTASKVPTNPTPSNPGTMNPGTVNPTNPTTPVNPPAQKDSIFQIVPPEGDGEDGAKVTISKVGNKISVSGTMKRQTPTAESPSGMYTILKIVAPEVYSQDQLHKTTIERVEYKDVLSEANGGIITGYTSDGKAYIDLRQGFHSKQLESTTLIIDWGNGIKVKYVIELNITLVN